VRRATVTLRRHRDGGCVQVQACVAQRLLAISQFEKAVGAKSFPMRNRTMALLSETTIIVDAGEKSGTAYQGWECLRLGRLLFLMESLASRRQPWTEELIQYGAQVLSKANVEAFLDSIPERASAETLVV